MADVTNGVLKFYDEKTQNWVVVETEPIAEKVVEIMRDDWLSHKGRLECWLLKYTTEDDENVPEPIYVALFVDSESVKNYDKDTLEYFFKDYINNLSNKKNFKLNNFIKEMEDTKVVLPQQFNVEINMHINDPEMTMLLKEHNNITDNSTVTDVLINNTGSLTASYIYNGHAIPEKQYTHKANQ